MSDGSQDLQDPQPEMTPEQLAADAAAEADFEAAYSNARGEEPHTVETTTTGAAASGTDSTASSQQGADTRAPENDSATGATLVKDGAATPPPNDDDAPVTITKRQLAELTSMGATVAALQNELRQTVDKTNGRFGTIQQTLKEVKEQAAKGIRPSFEQLEAMEDSFPELAEVLKRDLARAFGAGNETQPPAPEQDGQDGDQQQGDAGAASGAEAPGEAQALNPLQAPEVRAKLREAHLAIVDARHAGWRELPATKDWQEWRDQLPPAARELLRTTSDAETLSEAIADFKAYQQRRAAAASASNQRDERLEHGTPATTGASAPVRTTMSDDEAFEAAFKEVRSR